MGHHQQSDSLSTITDVPLSGTGTSTPEAVAGNADYSAWPWETVLATAASIPIPDRSEVTGQPWLTIGHDGQGGAGSHLIWTAGWNTGQNSGATSIDVYLNPALYTAGGAWDRFLNSPPQALSGVLSRQYAGLPLVPPSFDGASLVVASATNFWESAAQQFGVMHDDAMSGPIVGFQGNLASVTGELLSHLRTVTVSLHQQMTEPVRYSDSIEAAGGSAATFLADLLSAHYSWTKLVEHSPLGAVVTVLEQIATPDPGGGYVIPDPQNTPYGDLTIDSSWAVVEQHAKNLWTDALSVGSTGFAGLDPLGRTALNKMVNQFAATTSALVPVVGPAPPRIHPNPVNPTANNGGPGHTYVKIPPPGGAGAGSPGSGPPPNLAAQSSGSGGAGPVGGLSGPGGPGHPGGLGGVVGSFVTGGAPGGSAPLPPGGNPNPVLFATTSVLASGAPGLAAAAGSTSAGGAIFARSAHQDGGVSAPAGASSPANGSASNLPTDLVQPGFTGAIGRPAASGGNENRRRKGMGGRAGPGKDAAAAAPLIVPVAGFSLGRDPGGVVLQQSVVPTMAAKPPAVTSSMINVQPVQPSGGTVPATAGAPTGGPPVAAPVAGTRVPAEGITVVTGDGGMLGPGMLGAPQAVGAGGTDVEGGLAMPPMGRMGGLGGAGPSLDRVERQRLSYLPEESRFWGTEPDLVTSLGIAAGDDDISAEQDFDAAPLRIAGIGARNQTEERENAATDWRML